jgi:pyruvate dehydrogenase complex dihydrolipoamide acetyltransferase long form
MEEGTIVKWMKAEGDSIEAGDVVCDIQTDKAVVSMEADEDGVLAKIMKGADSGSIKVGELIAVVAEDGEDWKTVAVVGDDAAEAAADQSAAPVSATTGGSTPGTIINMPSLSPTMTEGTIVKWYKQEGESISAGDVLCDIQTDKAVVSMECDDDGVVAKILMEEGAAGVQVGTLIALMVEEGQDWKDVAIPAAEAQESSQVEQAPSSSVISSTPAASSPPTTSYPLPSQTGPAASLLLAQYGLNPASIEGSGPKGNLTKADVLKHIQTNSLPTPAPPQVPLPAMAKPAAPPAPQAVPVSTNTAYTDIELSSMRKVIAKRLTDSKQDAPHGYSSATANLSGISRLRQDYIRSGHKVSVNDFVIKAVATALQYVPEMNATLVNEEVRQESMIDISVAVATPAGLITPIVKDAGGKNIQQISAQVKELAGRAKENKLKLDEFQGGTFTISNLGMFGIAEFTAIINAPQLAILAVGGGRTIIDPDTMKPTTVMTSTLSFDRRYIDEALAADFMKVYQTILERPELLGTGYLSSVRLDRVAAAV